MDATGALNGSYNWGLVALSMAPALFASYAALDLAGRATSAQGLIRTVWLCAGAVTMGLGMWSMQCIGMAAFSLPVAVSYDLPTAFLALLASIALSGMALFVVSREKMALPQEIAGGVILGGGIAAVDYIGVAAMRCAAVIAWDRKIVALSIILAIASSLLALRLAFRSRNERSGRGKVAAAVVMGGTIPLTHYAGMWAATFFHSNIRPDLMHAAGISTIGILAVSAISFLASGVAIGSSFYDRVISLQKGNLDTARERELYFHTMAEAMPEILWTADPDGSDDYFNQKIFDYTGMDFDQLRGSGWAVIVHPDDVGPCFAKWEAARRTGEPYDVEYRLRGKDGTFRWFIGRANPIRDSAGKIVKWFGTCTDIEDQKQSQQILEEQILERTLQLADLNARLQEEMSQKDSARNQLDRQNESMMLDLERRSERATMLAKMGELLQSCISREEVIAAALGYAPKIFSTERGAVALLNASRSMAEVIGSWSECQLPMKEFESTQCWALRIGHPHMVMAGDLTARCPHAAGVTDSYLCVPILAQGETLGILHLQATGVGTPLESAELSFKTTFAGQLGLSIANIRLREALRTQSVRDALTGLYNRRYLEEVLEREVRRSVRASQSLGILMIDLDHFKTFNDTYGHDAGDAVLRETGAALVRGVRAEDFVCRFGGEEFVVILPTADLDAARMRAERLRMRMKELTVLYQGKSMGMLTISIGVAALPANGLTPKALMAAADAALYEAKGNGRDQVVVAGQKEEREGSTSLNQETVET